MGEGDNEKKAVRERICCSDIILWWFGFHRHASRRERRNYGGLEVPIVNNGKPWVVLVAVYSLPVIETINGNYGSIDFSFSNGKDCRH